MFLTLNSWNQRNWENSTNSRINTKKKKTENTNTKQKQLKSVKVSLLKKRKKETGKRKEREKERNGTVSALEWWLRSVCKEGVEGRRWEWEARARMMSSAEKALSWNRIGTPKRYHPRFIFCWAHRVYYYELCLIL